jgi:hypothetical protein
VRVCCVRLCLSSAETLFSPLPLRPSHKLVIASGASGSCVQELALVELVASAFTFSLEQLNSIMRVIDDSMTRVRVLPTQPSRATRRCRRLRCSSIMHYRYTRDCSQALVLLFGRVAAGNFWEIFHTTTDSWAALESPGLTKHQAVRRFRLRLNGPLSSPSAPSCLLNASADRILSYLDATVSGGMLPM